MSFVWSRLYILQLGTSDSSWGKETDEIRTDCRIRLQMPCQVKDKTCIVSDTETRLQQEMFVANLMGLDETSMPELMNDKT
jgi:hypothetical protein